MNWTEGALARHSRGPGWRSDVARQQEYFAKVRAGRRETSKPDISSISFFQRHSPNSRVQLQKNSQAHHAPSTPHAQSQLSHQNSQSRPGYRRNSEQLQRGDGHVGGFVSARSLATVNQSAKRQRISDPDDAFEAKRRRLLKVSDWAGLNMQKTLSMEFPVHENRAGKMWNFHRKQTTRDHGPFVDRNGHPAQASRIRLLSKQGSTHHGSPSIHIRIGSDVQNGGSSQYTISSPCKRLSGNRPTSKVKRLSGCESSAGS
ncbi:hypothetical protein CKAH01_01329 [Colletotrichum kahawae]|uniref:Uncharacterized protein n=1 Tax=Colletotrichum kahawae TaxID=34407 RepID=A0AAD9YDI8_COLKA|nr:hypothetical protein CKAH01_01329 [Colletotrichum kahawae]